MAEGGQNIGLKEERSQSLTPGRDRSSLYRIIGNPAISGQHWCKHCMGIDGADHEAEIGYELILTKILQATCRKLVADAGDIYYIPT